MIYIYSFECLRKGSANMNNSHNDRKVHSNEKIEIDKKSMEQNVDKSQPRFFDRS